jgi:hypothetical protein
MRATKTSDQSASNAIFKEVLPGIGEVPLGMQAFIIPFLI